MTDLPANAVSKDMEWGLMRPHKKKLCKADNAAEVIGPVDRGERMMAQKGASNSGNGTDSTSIKETPL